MKVPTLTISCRDRPRPADDIFAYPGCPQAGRQYLLDLLAQVPDPRKRRALRHPPAGLLAVGIAAVAAGSRSFAAIGQWPADAGPEVLAVLGAARGPAEESTFGRAFALVSADVLDRVLGAWLWTRAMQAGGRLVIAVDGKIVRGAKGSDEVAQLRRTVTKKGKKTVDRRPCSTAPMVPWPRLCARRCLSARSSASTGPVACGGSS
jgi:hypothetical protein